MGQNWKANGQDSINYTAEDPATHFVDGSNINDVAPFDINPVTVDNPNGDPVWMHVEYVIDLKGENNGFNGDATYDMYIDNQLVLTGEYHDATEQGMRTSIPLGPVRLLSRFQEVRFEHGTSAPLAVFIDNVRVQPFTPPVAQPGDLNSDGVCNAADIDALRDGINAGTDVVTFDLNGDSMLNMLDLDHMVRVIKETQYGDSNLDKNVDAQDLAKVRTTFGAPGGWADGNMTLADGNIDAGDLALVRTFFGFSNTSPAAVPEPASLAALLAVGVLAFSRRTSR